jgi:hypothetical protein
MGRPLERAAFSLIISQLAAHDGKSAMTAKSTNVRIGESILSYENKFTYIENLAAPIVARITERRSLTSLTPMDQATLHTFVIAQFLRSKKRRLDQAVIGLEIRRRWPEADLGPGHEEITNEEFEKFSSLEFAFSKLDEFASILVSKHSYLLVRNCPGELYISDNPMVMHNSKEYGPYGNIGIAVPHIEIYYPMSADIVLAYMCPLSMKETEEAHHAAEKEVNSLFSRMFMSPQGISTADRIQIEESRARIRTAKNYYSMIKSERLVPISSENLLFLNSLQVLSSFRYLACRGNDFTFAVKALSERPHWKEGVGIKVA